MLAVQLLGPVRAWQGDHELPLGPAQQRSVFAVLAAAGGAPVGRSELVDALWPEAAPDSAANVVQTYVKRLRQVLEPQRAPRSPSDVLPAAGEGYRLLVEQVDLLTFRRLVSEARQTDDAEERWRLLRAATQLWRGAPYAGTRLADRAHALAAERDQAICSYAQAALEVGRAAEAAPVLESATQAAPLHEAMHAALIRVQHATGRRSDAFATYLRVRERLVDQLGVDPGPELARAHADLLAAGPDGDLAGEAGGDAPPAQLPADIPDVVGRDQEIGELVDVLREPVRGRAPTVVTVSGMGGVGKTTLAVRAAHVVADDFPDGQLYVDLAGTRADRLDPGSALTGFLLALGVDGSAMPDDLGQRAALFRSRTARRRLLILLDNAADEAQVRPLLPGHASCVVVVTSRQRLTGLSVARALDLDVLDDRDAVALLEHIVGRDLGSRDREGIEQVAALCAGMPLAVRIAGARLAAQPGQPVGRYATTLLDERRRLDQLSTPDLSVRASLALGYHALSEPARRAYRRLGVLGLPDCAEWAVAALLGTSHEEAQLAVDDLVGAHLLMVEPTSSVPRLRLHDLVRLHAHEAATSEESPEDLAAARWRARRAWLAHARVADAALPYRTLDPRDPDPLPLVPATVDDAADWFTAERVNLRLLVEQSAAEGDADTAWRLCDAMLGHLEMRDLYDDWRHTHSVALAALAPDSLGAAVLTRNLASLETLPTLHPPAMLELGGRAAGMFERLGDVEGRVDSLVICGMALAWMGSGEESLATLDEALELAETHGYVLGARFARTALGSAYGDRAMLDDAARHLAEASRPGSRVTRSQLTSLRSLALIRHREGDHEESDRLIVEALALSMALGLRSQELLCLLFRAECHPDEPWLVEDLLHRSLALADVTGGRIGLALVRRGFALLDLARGRADRAREQLEAALETFRAERAQALELGALVPLALAHLALGDAEECRRQGELARDVATRLGNAPAVVALSQHLAALDA